MLVFVAHYLRVVLMVSLAFAVLGSRVVAAVQGSSEATVAVLSLSGHTMGAGYAIQWVPTGPQAEDVHLDQVAQGVGTLLRGFEAALTTYAEDSPLLRWNRSQQTSPQSVHPEIGVLVQIGLGIHEQSEGALDLTALPLVRLWGFGPGSKKNPVEDRSTPPTSDQLKQALSRVGMKYLVFDPEEQVLGKRFPELELDLNSVAPGRAADLVGTWLEHHGVSSYLIDIGGELLARGRKPSGELWAVGVETPSEHYGSGIEERVVLENEAIATSGSYRKARMNAGRRISHIIDPRSGRPVEHGVVSASVIQSRAALADGWATAMMVLGATDGIRIADQLGIPVLLISQNDQGGFQALRSQTWLSRQKRLSKEMSSGLSHLLGRTLLTASVFAVIILAMAVGVIFRRKPIQGSCGGIANVMGESGCDACESKSQCKRKSKGLPQVEEDALT